MGLKRVGILLFVLGLCLSLFWSVAFGFVSGSTEVRCVDHQPTYTIQSVDVADLNVVYSDGCNGKWVDSTVTFGGLVSLSGLLVGGGGVLREWSTEP